MTTGISHNALVDKAILNTNYFKFNDLFLKGCRSCNKLVKHNHTTESRFMKESRFVYICECNECKNPLLLDSVDMYLLNGKV
jgi:hypothetical protein